MRIGITLGIAALGGVVLASCTDGSSGAAVDNSGTRGSLIQNPPARTVSLSATDFTAQLDQTSSGKQLLALATGGAAAVRCGVDVYYIQYATVGGAGEQTTASGALMVPTGAAADGCSGPRPIVLYAHGTETDHSYNMANLLTPVDDRIPMTAAVFASNGFIVVAPNYAGYDSSTLPYHPYLNADQQSKDMLDALAAARTALSSGKMLTVGTTFSGGLYITGYSQGGHVAMATQRALEQSPLAGVTLKAAVPSSGPYALAAMFDTVVGGSADFGSSGFGPLVMSNFHNSYKANSAVGDVYFETGTANDIYEDAWANADTLFPGPVSVDTLILNGTYPLALFDGTVPGTAAPVSTDIAAGVGFDVSLLGVPSAAAGPLTAQLQAGWSSITPTAGNPVFATGFATGTLAANGKPAHLWRDSYRASYLADAAIHPDGLVPAQTTGLPAGTPLHPARKAARLSDLRGYVPGSPLRLCGGHNDPEVFFPVNASSMMGIWSTVPGLVGASSPALVRPVLDIDPGLNLDGTSTTSTSLAYVAAGAFVAYLSTPGLATVDPTAAAAAISTAINAANGPLSPANYTLSASPTDAALQVGFLQGTGQAISTLVTPAAVSGIISQATGKAPPFTVAAVAPSTAAIATGIGTATLTAVIEAYHSNLVAPFCHVGALEFFLANP
jgi:hypothetical protein